jgi:serine/threonine protein kinase
MIGKLRKSFSLLNEYLEFEEVLGSGGGAEAVVKSRGFAVKIFVDNEKKFERELSIVLLAASLELSPYVCIGTHYLRPVLDGTRSYAAIAMPFVPGKPIDSNPGAVNGSFCCKVFSGLAYLHANGIVHADITPSNIMATSDGDPVLIDFDWARTKSECRTRGEIATYAYVSPDMYKWTGYEEKTDGWEIYCANDVWACSISLLVCARDQDFKWMHNSETKMREFFRRPRKREILNGRNFKDPMQNILATCGLKYDYRSRSSAVAMETRLKAFYSV